MKKDVLVQRSNKQACESVVHKATGKRNAVLLFSLQHLLDTRQFGEEQILQEDC